MISENTLSTEYPCYTGNHSIVYHFQLDNAVLKFEKPCKVCRSEMAGITLLSAHVHDESLSANLFNLRLIYAVRSLPLVFSTN